MTAVPAVGANVMARLHAFKVQNIAKLGIPGKRCAEYLTLFYPYQTIGF